NEPRFYSFKISQHKNLWRLGEGQVHFLSLPTTGKVKTVVDPESIVKLPTGSFLVASEGDNNKRPRVPPRIFEVDAKGKWLRDLKLPDVLIPEALGQAKKGVSNNFSIEAMALSKEGS